MSRTTYSRETMAEIWLTGLSDRERHNLVSQFEALNGGPGIAPPSPVELFSEFNAGAIHLEDGKASRDSQD